MSNEFLTVNAETRDALRKAYEAALERGDDTLVFRGHEMSTSWTKYAIEYADMVLVGKEEG